LSFPHIFAPHFVRETNVIQFVAVPLPLIRMTAPSPFVSVYVPLSKTTTSPGETAIPLEPKTPEPNVEGVTLITLPVQ
jgi:hypothetical protein